MKSVIYFSLTFEKEYGVSLLATWMVNIVDVTVSFDFLTSSIPHTFQRYIQVAKVLLQLPYILNVIAYID